MRILTVGNMYPPHHLGGYELMWRSAVAHLRRAGHEVRVLTTDYRLPGVDEADREPDVHRELRWYWREHEIPPIGALARLRLERHNARVLDRHLHELRPDVVSWWALGGMSLSLVERMRRAGVPAAGVVVDDWMIYGPLVDAWTRAFASRPRLAPLAGHLTGVPTRVNLGAAGPWLFVSETTRRRALEHGVSLPDTEVAHAGVDTGLFRLAEPRPWRWRLLYLGRIEERKGIDHGIEALQHLPPEATLDVVGRGDEAHLERLRSLAAESGLEERVRFGIAAREDVPGVYAEADVVIFPVRWPEPFGLVPLEAMAIGRPVVASGRGGSGEYLRHEQNCLIADPDLGPAALASAIARLADDEALRGRLRAGGLETAARFPESAFNQRVEALLERAR